jgi:predicted alpha/beta-fold hydrolase
MSVHGHYWTVRPVVAHRLRPLPPPPCEPFRLCRLDAGGYELPTTGLLTRADPRRLLILVHGLGGSAESLYLRRAARAAYGRGLSVLRVNLRGADGSGCDFFHAGLTEDLHHLLGCQELAGFDTIFIHGFSVGGHVVLKLATENLDPRVAAVAALCSPLDLDATVEDFDGPWAWAYRKHVFRGLLAHYEAVSRHRPVPTPLETLRKVKSLRQMDSLTVVPRFGFGTAENYYATVSVGPRLGQLKRPALLVATEADPMVTARSVRSGLAAATLNHRLEVVWSEQGGHVGFPDGVNLGLGFSGPIDDQIHGWLLRHG